VAVVLNTAGLIDLSWADDPLLRQRIRALLYVWHGAPTAPGRLRRCCTVM
jgi:hypothetical protein